MEHIIENYITKWSSTYYLDLIL